MALAYWACALFTLLSACISLAYSYLAVRDAHDQEAGTHARYAFARSAALATVCVVPLISESSPWLIAVATAMILVQAADALIGVGIGDRLKTWGPAGTAATNAALLAWYVTR